MHESGIFLRAANARHTVSRNQVLLPFLYPKQPLASSCRGLSNSAKRLQPAAGTMAFPRIKIPPQKSFKVALKEKMREGAIPNDMGLLPDTFIMPSGPNKPSLLKMPRERFALEWHRLFIRVKDRASIFIYRKTTQTPRPKIQFWNKAAAARSLHSQMYSAFADGDLDILRDICTDGLLNTFTARISQRRPFERFRWILHKYRGSPRVVSHRAAPFPGMDGAGIRQAVVRIRSLQSLQSSAEEDASEDINVKEKTEYIVIQKRMIDGVEGAWMVWGTVGESDWKKLIA